MISALPCAQTNSVLRSGNTRVLARKPGPCGASQQTTHFDTTSETPSSRHGPPRPLATAVMADGPHAAGLTGKCVEALQPLDLAVTGALPPWLDGIRLLRNGPGEPPGCSLHAVCLRAAGSGRLSTGCEPVLPASSCLPCPSPPPAPQLMHIWQAHSTCSWTRGRPSRCHTGGLAQQADQGTHLSAEH